MGLRYPLEQYLLVLLATCIGCSEGATLVRETPTGGIVTYAFKEERGALFSRYRAEALKLIDRKCPTGYTIVIEGEARGHRSVSGIVEGAEDQTKHHRWALQFRCKSR